MNRVLVSIACTNYNKEYWISEAIESFLCQKTSFEYEILLIDDKSDDHSPEIIKQYAAKYPDKIRAFYNKKNLGITKTWIKICKEAKGKYIARCDGDDYWIDKNKLQKQINLLEKNKNSRWCCTDYNIVDAKGETTHYSAVNSGHIKLPESYAEMFATKGFTMSSTWLVDTKLMQQVNAELNDTAVDDTFNIQLDLFNRTSLSYLPEATVAYRLIEGSDSHPEELTKIISRHRRLIKTQLEYLEKYKNVDYKKILKILLDTSTNSDLLAAERLHIIQRQQRRIEELERGGSVTKGSLPKHFYRLIRKAIRMPTDIFKRRNN